MTPESGIESPRFEPASTPRLMAGEVVLVTGAAMGNGAAIARGLAASGASIAAADRDTAALASTVEAIRAEGGEIAGFGIDVADLASCERAAGEVEERFGPVSVIVNNAGIVRRVGIEEDQFVASVESQFTINALGSAHVVRAFLPQLRRTKGRVINVGSIASFSATTGGVGYGLSKGGVLMMTKTLAAELAPFGIRVNGVAPGVMITPMTEPTRTNAGTANKYLERIPLNRFGDAGELIGPVLFLASPMSSYVTGVMLPVDGGYLAT